MSKNSKFTKDTPNKTAHPEYYYLDTLKNYGAHNGKLSHDPEMYAKINQAVLNALVAKHEINNRPKAIHEMIGQVKYINNEPEEKPSQSISSKICQNICGSIKVKDAKIYPTDQSTSSKDGR